MSGTPLSLGIKTAGRNTTIPDTQTQTFTNYLNQPTVICCVPLVLERIYKGVNEVIKKKGSFFENLFDFCVRYKTAAVARGEVTPIMDKLIFRGVRALLGGRVRIILAGGAPLSPESHDFLRTAMGCPLMQVECCSVS